MWAKVMRRLDDAGKSGSTTANSSIRTTVVDRGPQQSGYLSSCHSNGFVVINYPPCGPHTCLQYDPLQTTRAAILNLRPTEPF
ncbi:hypothetical protein TNCV_4272991 [Trichonephila clavipes]|nr:hypothetical protein TNCV_4272991 [Trichonephila clavipes]